MISKYNKQKRKQKIKPNNSIVGVYSMKSNPLFFHITFKNQTRLKQWSLLMQTAPLKNKPQNPKFQTEIVQNINL